MVQIRKLQTQYVTDEAGNKMAVILPLEEFEELLDDLEDLATLAERHNEPTIPFEEVKKLVNDNSLPDCMKP